MQVFTQPACLSPLCMAASSKSKTPQTSMVISGMAILKCSCSPEYMLHLLVPSRRMDYGFNCALKCMDSWPNRPSASFMWMHWRNKAMFLLQRLFPCNGSSQKKKKKKVKVNMQSWLLGICFSKCESWSRLFAQISFGVDGRLSPMGLDAARTAHWFSKQSTYWADEMFAKCLNLTLTAAE